MSVASLIEYVMSESQYLPQAESSVAVVELVERDREEVLGFLAERPIHTVAMAGLIRDNGFVSEHNRGTSTAAATRTVGSKASRSSATTRSSRGARDAPCASSRRSRCAARART